jgi:hypothetical protein
MTNYKISTSDDKENKDDNDDNVVVVVDDNNNIGNLYTIYAAMRRLNLSERHIARRSEYKI